MMHRRLPPAPPEYHTYESWRHSAPATEARGIGFRFVRRRPRKKQVHHPLDPHPSTTGDRPPALPMWWQIPASTLMPGHLTAVISLPWFLAAAAEIADPGHRAYMEATYTHGFDDHSDLPTTSYRFHVKNSVLPGTLEGDAWDELIEQQERLGRILEFSAPILAGTVISPMGCDIKVKYYDDGTEKAKYRPYIDGRSTRKEHRNLGAWSHPCNRQYTSQNIHDTITDFIVDNAAAANIFDYKGFYLTLPRTIETIPHNAIFWQRPGRQRPSFIYFKDELFGMVPTPSKGERHASILQSHQEAAVGRFLNRKVRISRRCDDSLVPLTASEVARAAGVAAAFSGVCDAAGQPAQRAKTLIAAVRFKFDGYQFDLNAFPNNTHGVHPGGVGIDAGRARRLRDRLIKVQSGADRKHVESLIGSIEWVAALAPHIRALIISLRKAMLSVSGDATPVPTNPEMIADVQRLTRHFEFPRMVPFYKLFKLTPHQIDLFTDASGIDAFGGYMDGLFWSEPLTTAQVLTPTLMAKDEDDDELSLATLYLELVAAYYMLVVARRRLHNKIVRWTTDAQAAAKAWVRQSSKHTATNRLLVLMGDYCTTHSIIMEAHWIPREQNSLADMLTHNRTQHFCDLTGAFPSQQVQIPRWAVKKVARIQQPWQADSTAM